MAILEIRFLAPLGLAIALASCAAPKAEVIADAPPAEKKKTPVVVAEVPEPEMPTLPDDEIRMPSLLNLPTDDEFRASNPLLPKSGTGSGVVVRPPTDPPSRVKPGEKPIDE